MAAAEWEKALSWLRVEGHKPKATHAAALQRYFTKYPDQLNVAEEVYGRLPLHRAARNLKGEHAVTIVTFLLNAYRDGVRQKNNGDRLPLHLAAFHQRGEPGAAIVTLLLTAYPTGAMQKNERGKLPADLAENNDDLPDSCKAMLRAAAEGKWAPPVPFVAQGEE